MRPNSRQWFKISASWQPASSRVPFRNATISFGSVQVSHSCSVTVASRLIFLVLQEEVKN